MYCLVIINNTKWSVWSIRFSWIMKMIKRLLKRNDILHPCSPEYRRPNPLFRNSLLERLLIKHPRHWLILPAFLHFEPHTKIKLLKGLTCSEHGSCALTVSGTHRTRGSQCIFSAQVTQTQIIIQTVLLCRERTLCLRHSKPFFSPQHSAPITRSQL